MVVSVLYGQYHQKESKMIVASVFWGQYYHFSDIRVLRSMTIRKLKHGLGFTNGKMCFRQLPECGVKHSLGPEEHNMCFKFRMGCPVVPGMTVKRRA